MQTKSQPARTLGRFLAASVAALTLTAPAFAQESRSAAAARDLSDTMDRLKLDSIAAADPGNPGTFVAALYFQGAQLLVVSAKYAAPTLLVDKIAKKDYRDTYIDLNSASVAGTKVFIMDQGANGLVGRPEDDQPADTWEQDNKTMSFDGEWRKAKLSEEEYMKTFSTADERYARILTLLAEQAKKSAGSN
jgi:hypothetical protein